MAADHFRWTSSLVQHCFQPPNQPGERLDGVVGLLKQSHDSARLHEQHSSSSWLKPSGANDRMTYSLIVRLT